MFNLPIAGMIFNDPKYNLYWTTLIYKGVPSDRYLISTYGDVFDVVQNKLCNVIYDEKKDPYPYFHPVRDRTVLKFGKVRIHEAVAESFLGYRASDKTHINHMDGVKKNSYAFNLEYCTPKENAQHAIAHGLR